MKLPKVRELLIAVKALTTKPYTSKFPKDPHIPYPAFRGQPEFNPDMCVGCLGCEQVCPVGAIAHEDIVENGKGRRIIYHYTDTCIFCGSCEATCIADNQGIKLSNKWDLAFFDRKEAYETIEKELQLCEMCGAVIGCKDHLNWIAKKLGELAFSSPTLYQTRLRELGIIDENILVIAKEYGRADRVKILCARCRRETTLTTE